MPEETILVLQEQVRSHLKEQIIPFWRQRAWDREFGGFLTNFDADGNDVGTPEKYLNTQARLIWGFSAFHGLYHRPEDAELARLGVDWLIDKFWDAERGGWFWKVGRDGRLIDDGKIVYGQSFAIYALAQYALSVGDARGLEYASRTFDLLQTYCADTLHGGYYENLRSDWTPEADGFRGGDRKGLDTHMHLMESFTTLLAAGGREIHRRKLLEIVDLIATRMIDPASGCGGNQFDPAFRPLPAIAILRTWNAERQGDAPAVPTDTTSYGHNVELAWLMRRALETSGRDLWAFRPVMKRLLDHAVEHGVDWEHGGIFRDGARQGGALILEKEFWQHAESLVGFLDGYQLLGDKRYLDAFQTLWDFVRRHMINRAVGEWRTLLDREGRILDGNMGNPWKACYHSGRSMIECLQRLECLGRQER